MFSVKSRQMPRTSGGTKSARPVNSLVKKVWLSFGSDAIALRSSRGAQATPTENMVMPGGLKEIQVLEGTNTNCRFFIWTRTLFLCSSCRARDVVVWLAVCHNNEEVAARSRSPGGENEHEPEPSRTSRQTSSSSEKSLQLFQLTSTFSLTRWSYLNRMVWGNGAQAGRVGVRWRYLNRFWVA